MRAGFAGSRGVWCILYCIWFHADEYEAKNESQHHRFLQDERQQCQKDEDEDHEEWRLGLDSGGTRPPSVPFNPDDAKRGFKRVSFATGYEGNELTINEGLRGCLHVFPLLKIPCRFPLPLNCFLSRSSLLSAHTRLFLQSVCVWECLYMHCIQGSSRKIAFAGSALQDRPIETAAPRASPGNSGEMSKSQPVPGYPDLTPLLARDEQQQAAWQEHLAPSPRQQQKGLDIEGLRSATAPGCPKERERT